MYMKWDVETPTKPGKYWFYGDPFMGSMGGHYTGAIKPHLELILVKIDNNFAVGNGHFIPTRKFDKNVRQEGHLGYWLPAKLPTTPKDINKLFGELHNEI